MKPNIYPIVAPYIRLILQQMINQDDESWQETFFFFDRSYHFQIEILFNDTKFNFSLNCSHLFQIEIVSEPIWFNIFRIFYGR